MGRLIEAFAQFFDNAGDPLINGWLEFLESKSTSTKKNTFADENFQVVNQNPVQLDGSGRCPNVFGQGDYRVISYTRNLEDETDVGDLVQLFDPVTAQGTGSGGSGGAGLVAWDPASTYNVGDIVTYIQNVYRSLINGNVGLNPATETSSWEQVEFVQIWNINVTYEINNIVRYEGNFYVSRASLNAGNQPDASPTFWRPVADSYIAANVETANYEILPSQRDNFFILSASATGDAQFDLPVMSASTDLFRVGIYNASTFDLTLNGLGGIPIWTDPSGDVILGTGQQIELIYIHALVSWVPLNNSVFVMGDQQYRDNQGLFFGTGKDSVLIYDGTDFTIKTVLGGGRILLGTDNTAWWELATTGSLIPTLTGSGVIDLGSTTQLIRNVYLADSGSLFLGSDQDASLFHNGSDLFIGTTTGDMIFSTTSIQRWVLSAAGNFLPSTDNTYDIGSASFQVANVYIANQPTVDNMAANKAYVDAQEQSDEYNLVINPGFTFNQRGIASGTLLTLANTYFLDMWKSGTASSSPTWAGGILTVPVTHTVKQVIESDRIPNGTYTLSWSGTSQARVDGGSYQTSPYTFVVSSGANVELEFNEGNLSEVVLVNGPIEGRFVPRPESVERALCERYYQLIMYGWQGYALIGTSVATHHNLRVPMSIFTAASIVPGTTTNIGFSVDPGIIPQECQTNRTPRVFGAIRALQGSALTTGTAQFFGWAQLEHQL